MGGLIYKTIFNRIKRNAKVRKIPFFITEDFVVELFHKQNGKCALSGLDLNFGESTTDETTASLDRINSHKSYDPENVQWVHKDINLMKMDFDEKYFIFLCARVADKNNIK